MRTSTLVASLIASVFLLSCFVPAYTLSIRKAAPATTAAPASQSVTLTPDQYNALLSKYGGLLGNQGAQTIPTQTTPTQTAPTQTAPTQNTQSSPKLYQLPNGTVVNQQQLDALNAQSGNKYQVANNSQGQTQSSAPTQGQTQSSTPSQNPTLYRLPNGTIVNQQQLDALNAQSGNQYRVANNSNTNQTQTPAPAPTQTQNQTKAPTPSQNQTQNQNLNQNQAPADNQTYYKLPNGSLVSQQQLDALNAQSGNQYQVNNQNQTKAPAQTQTQAPAPTQTQAPAPTQTQNQTKTPTPTQTQTQTQAPAQNQNQASTGNQTYYELPNGTKINQQQAQSLLSDPNSGYSLKQ